jgi:amino acid transporter
MLAKVIFSRTNLILIYFTLTVITCFQAMFNSSFAVGGGVLIACALCFFAVAPFSASVLARREKEYSTKELIGIGMIAAILTAGGLALMVWSGFWIKLYGVSIQGIYWALLGIIIAIVVARKKDAL